MLKKKLAILAVIVLSAALFLGACGSKEGQDAKESESSRASELTITKQPEDVEIAAGKTVKFTVKAEGGAQDTLTYQWQVTKDGKEWVDCTAKGCKTAKYHFTAKEAYSGRQYRCIVQNGDLKVVTASAKLTVKKAGPKIQKQPEKAAANIGENVTFTVAAKGKGDLTYQWQMKTGEEKWKECTAEGSKKDTITVPVTEEAIGTKYRCIVQDDTGKTTSKAATLLLAGTEETSEDEDTADEEENLGNEEAPEEGVEE